jgi:hypothetical protein
MHDLVCAVRHPKYLGFGLRPLFERRGVLVNLQIQDLKIVFSPNFFLLIY